MLSGGDQLHLNLSIWKLLPSLKQSAGILYSQWGEIRHSQRRIPLQLMSKTGGKVLHSQRCLALPTDLEAALF